MAWLHEVGSAVRALFGRAAQETEMDEEMRFHVEMESQRLEHDGLPPDEARRRALCDFGGVERHKEGVRDERGVRSLEDLSQDVRFAMRSLRRRPGFASVAAITLALGIGASTALFGVVKAVLLTPLPYGHPESIAMIWSAWPGFDKTWVSYDEWEVWDNEIPAIADVALFSDGAVSLSGGDEPERIRAGYVQANVFSVLGVAPLLGRGFSAEEDRPDGPHVMILGNAIWKRRFGADPAIVGQSVAVGGVATTVVGVMPSGFQMPLDFAGGEASEVYLPLATDAESQDAVAGPAFGNDFNHSFFAVARLAPNATTEQATRQMTTYIAGLVRDGIYPAEQQFRAFAIPVQDEVTGGVRPALLVVFGAVALVLLISCVNVAGLLLVRGDQRRRELAIRVALGARTARIRRLLLTESVMISAVGGAAGVGLAALGVWLVRLTAPAGVPRLASTGLDVPVLLFALSVTILAATLAGVLPASQGAHVAPAKELKEGGRGTSDGRSRLRLRQSLVAAEVALAVVLVIGAGLMIRSVTNLLAIDTGFNPRRVLTVRISTPSTWYPDSIRVAEFFDVAQREIAAIAGVRAVGATRLLPLTSQIGTRGVQVQGYTPPAGQNAVGEWQVVTPGYADAMGLRLAAGRFLDARDGMDAPLTLVVNRSFVTQYFAGRDALGGRVRIGGSPRDAFASIVGVVEDVRHNGLTSAVKPRFYATLAQFAVAPGNTIRTMTLAVRTDGDPMSLVGLVRAAIRRIDPRLALSDVATMDRVVGRAIAGQRFAMQLLGLFGALALLLSAIGIFGIVSQMVASRDREYGVRAALGASPRELVLQSLRTAAPQTIAGLVAGLALALALTRVMTSMLHGVSAVDPLTFVLVTVVICGVSLAASLVPARRAGRVDPNIVLHEG